MAAVGGAVLHYPGGEREHSCDCWWDPGDGASKQGHGYGQVHGLCVVRVSVRFKSHGMGPN